jgi:hypothetical protein
MRHGYYIPNRGTEHGDPELRATARAIWDFFITQGRQPVLVQKDDEATEWGTRDWDEEPPLSYDGVSCYEAPDGSLIHRMILESKNVLPPQPRVLVRDLLSREVAAVTTWRLTR